MKIRKLCTSMAAVLFSCMFLLNGCGSSETIWLPYQTALPVVSIYSNTGTEAENLVPLFSSDLCVFSAKSSMLLSKDAVPDLGDASALLVNETDKKLYFQKDVFKRLYPASLTKLMTAYVVYKHGNMDADVTFSYEATHLKFTNARLCKFAEGDTMKLRDLLAAFLIYSGNDAGVALAETVSGSEEDFVKLMNKEAKSLGASGSHFSNSHGLHQDDHYTTMYDMYLIFHELLQNEDFISIISAASCEVPYTNAAGESQLKTFASSNLYHTGGAEAPAFFSIVGGKTGTTNEAGSCNILYVKDINGGEYVLTVMNAASADVLYQDLNGLLNAVPVS